MQPLIKLKSQRMPAFWIETYYKFNQSKLLFLKASCPSINLILLLRFWCIDFAYKIQLNLICFDLLVKVQVVFPFSSPSLTQFNSLEIYKYLWIQKRAVKISNSIKIKYDRIQHLCLIFCRSSYSANIDSLRYAHTQWFTVWCQVLCNNHITAI